MRKRARKKEKRYADDMRSVIRIFSEVVMSLSNFERCVNHGLRRKIYITMRELKQCQNAARNFDDSEWRESINKGMRKIWKSQF